MVVSPCKSEKRIVNGAELSYFRLTHQIIRSTGSKTYSIFPLLTALETVLGSNRGIEAGA
jgi:hypothetical protein